MRGIFGRLRRVVTGDFAYAQRNARIRPDGGLSKEPDAQFAARRHARYRRRRAAGFVRLSPARFDHRNRRRADLVDHVKVHGRRRLDLFDLERLQLAGSGRRHHLADAPNKTRQAESAVLAARSTLRLTEQTVLLAAATAYMNLLRDTAILDLQRRNVEVLQE